MKKLLFGVIPMMCLFTLSACDKDYTCVCTDLSDGSTLSTSTISASSSSDASAECDDKESIFLSDRCEIQD